jgi:hypothetical protein
MWYLITYFCIYSSEKCGISSMILLTLDSVLPYKDMARLERVSSFPIQVVNTLSFGTCFSFDRGWLIDWLGFYAVLVVFQPYHGDHGSYFYRWYYLISVKKNTTKLKNSKDTSRACACTSTIAIGLTMGKFKLFRLSKSWVCSLPLAYYL